MNPGSLIWFRRLGLVAKGELKILGTSENPVRMAGVGTSSWRGILLDRNLSANIISHCTISGAEFGFKAISSKVSFHHCLFQDNKWGIVLENAEAEIHNSLIRTSEKTGIAARKTQLLVKGSTISENGLGGFLLEESQAQIQQNNIFNNGKWAVKALDSEARVKAAQNWWGIENPEPESIIGSVEIEPVLKQPVAIHITAEF